MNETLLFQLDTNRIVEDVSDVSDPELETSDEEHDDDDSDSADADDEQGDDVE